MAHFEKNFLRIFAFFVTLSLSLSLSLCDSVLFCASVAVFHLGKSSEKSFLKAKFV